MTHVSLKTSDALHPQSFEVPASLPPHATAYLELDLEAVRQNYKTIQSVLKKGCRLSAVVKANAYGMGAIPTSKALYQAGCRDFFVINVDEALDIKPFLQDANIYILNGVQQGAAPILLREKFIPVLLSLEQIALWQAEARRLDQNLPAILHLDTGLSREGLSYEEVTQLHNNLALLDGLDIKYYMSHLANADESNNSENIGQLNRFQELCSKLPPAPKSFANSHGIMRGQNYHFDMARPGMAIFGYCDSFKEPNQLMPAIRIAARIIRRRPLSLGQPVGYNALFKAQKPMLTATLNIGYADGFLRCLTNVGKINIQGYPAQIIGKISMDYTVLDVTDIPNDLTEPGTWVEIVHDADAFEELCTLGGTCTYEIVARLGPRFQRVYKNEN